MPSRRCSRKVRSSIPQTMSAPNPCASSRASSSETAFEQLEQELPYSLAAQIEEFREAQSPVYIRAIIYVERDSQQGILVGHRGSRIREIGRAARIKIEQLVGAPVYLDLRVKVLSDWRRDPVALRRFGYLSPPPARS